MNKLEFELFLLLRKKVASYISDCLKDDCGHKSYEGTWELLVSYPNYFEDETATAKPDFYRITLHCYLIGPHRHYDWDGKTWDEALRKCRNDIERWTKELDSMGQGV